MDQRPHILYLENNSDDFLLMQLAIRQSQSSLQLHWVDDIASTRQFLLGQAPFANRIRYPFPKVVLVDYLLHGECGLELLRWMRQNPEPTLSALPVIIISDSDDDTRFQESYAEGATHCVRKPMEFERVVTFVQCLERCFSGKEPSLNDLRSLPEYRGVLREGSAVNRNVSASPKPPVTPGNPPRSNP